MHVAVVAEPSSHTSLQVVPAGVTPDAVHVAKSVLLLLTGLAQTAGATSTHILWPGTVIGDAELTGDTAAEGASMRLGPSLGDSHPAEGPTTCNAPLTCTAAHSKGEYVRGAE